MISGSEISWLCPRFPMFCIALNPWIDLLSIYYVLSSRLDSSIKSIPQILTDRHWTRCCGYEEIKHSPFLLKVHCPISESYKEGRGRGKGEEEEERDKGLLLPGGMQ